MSIAQSFKKFFKDSLGHVTSSIEFGGEAGAYHFADLGIGFGLGLLGSWLYQKDRESKVVRTIAQILGVNVGEMDVDYVLEKINSDPNYYKTIGEKIRSVCYSGKIDEFAKEFKIEKNEACQVYLKIKDLVLDHDQMKMLAEITNSVKQFDGAASKLDDIKNRMEMLGQIKTDLDNGFKTTYQKIDRFEENVTTEVQELKEEQAVKFDEMVSNQKLTHEKLDIIDEKLSQLNARYDEVGISTRITKNQSIELSERDEIEMELLYKEIKELRKKVESTTTIILEQQDFLLKRGNYFAFKEDSALALEYYNRVLEINPENVDALVDKAFVYEHVGLYERALDCYNRAIQIKQNDADLLANKASVLCDLKRYDESLQFYDKALELDPENPLEFGKRYTLFFSRRFEDLMQYYDNLLAKSPDNSGILRDKARDLMAFGEYEEAIQVYDKISQIEGRSTFWDKRRTLSESGKYEERIQKYDKILENDPANKQTLILKGDALAGLGRYEDSTEEYEKSLKLKSNDKFLDIVIMEEIARNYIQLKKYDKALKWVDEIEKEDDGRSLNTICLRIEALLKSGDYQQADILCEEFPPTAYTLEFCLYLMACCKANIGKRNLAIGYLARAIRYKPELKLEAKKDELLKDLYDDPRFKRLVTS